MKKIILVLSIIFLCSCSLFNEVDDVFIKNYLNNKYGDDITFTLSHMNTCNLMSMDSCEAYYTASDAEGEIFVTWTTTDGSDIKDDYLFKKYDKQLNTYYKNILSKVIDSNFKIEVFSNKSDYEWDNLSFDEFVKYKYLNSVISIHIASKNIDISELSDSIKSILKKNDITNVYGLYITTYNNGCDLTDVSKCQKINSSYVEVKIVENNKIVW